MCQFCGLRYSTLYNPPMSSTTVSGTGKCDMHRRIQWLSSAEWLIFHALQTWDGSRIPKPDISCVRSSCYQWLSFARLAFQESLRRLPGLTRSHQCTASAWAARARARRGSGRGTAPPWLGEAPSHKPSPPAASVAVLVLPASASAISLDGF